MLLAYSTTSAALVSGDFTGTLQLSVADEFPTLRYIDFNSARSDNSSFTPGEIEIRYDTLTDCRQRHDLSSCRGNLVVLLLEVTQ